MDSDKHRLGGRANKLTLHNIPSHPFAVKPTDNIRLLTASTNEQGDLFTRLMEDLFAALGYGKIRRDVAKPGREIDMHGTHYLEKRQMRAECKAHQRKMGGDDLGKFRGALLAEQIEAGKQKITGYFVSLGGFKESARLQEERLGNKGIILVDAPQIIHYLEVGKRIIPDAIAIDQASRCVQLAGRLELVPDRVELLGHQTGYIKAVYYAHNKVCTHVALIAAADGWPLAEAAAQEIIKADMEAGGDLATLQYLIPSASTLDQQQTEEQALAFYRAWVGRKCGFMQLDGLPIDGRLEKNLALERLFVPLKVKVFKKQVDAKVVERTTGTPNPISTATYVPNPDEALDVGQALGAAKHLALLAAPGSGKSTLLMRLATAYAFSERRAEVDDKLPAQRWLPVFLRCRDLRGETHKSVMQLLEELPMRLNMQPELATGFARILHKELVQNNLLLLVDGLDEIWDEGARKQLANHLKDFIEAYPSVKLVVTSREAGFRVIAGIIAEACYQARILPLTSEGITYLCRQWHAEVYGEAEDVQLEADKLSNQILSNSNVLSLARNPLLLTTLLVVKRSIGEMPTNRVALYAAAVQLLVKTWNIEGFNSLNERETFAQLCYVACAMTEAGEKQVSHPTLVKWLEQAREILAAELQYTRLSPEEFIHQVEHRSSLLMMVGYKKIQGELCPLYEFRHLTFQEYLTARGYVRNLHARRSERLSLLELLAPHIDDENWHEVIRLAAVLAEVEAEPLVEYLNALCELVDTEDLDWPDTPLQLLVYCLWDEVTVHPSILRESLKQLARFSQDSWIGQYVLPGMQGRRLGSLLQATVEEEFFRDTAQWQEYIHALDILCAPLPQKVILGQMQEDGTQPVEAAQVAQLLQTGTREQRVKAAFEFSLETKEWQVQLQREQQVTREWLPNPLRAQLLTVFKELLASGDPPSIYAGAWAIVHGFEGLGVLQEPEADAQLVVLLLRAWGAATDVPSARMLARALVMQPLLPRDTFLAADSDWVALGAVLTKWASAYYAGVLSPVEAKAMVLVAWYLRTPWSDSELERLLTQVYWASYRAAPGAVNEWRAEQLRRAADLLDGLEATNAESEALQLPSAPEYRRRAAITRRETTYATVPYSDDSDVPF